MIGNFERINVTVDVEGIEVDGRQVTPREHELIANKHKDSEQEKNLALFKTYVTDWRKMKDRHGNDIPCTAETKEALVDFDNGLSGRIVGEIVAKINEKKRQVEGNSSPGASGDSTQATGPRE